MAMESEEVEGIDAASKIWGNLLSKEQMKVLGIDGPTDGSNKRHKPEQQKKKKDNRSNWEASTTVPTSLLVKLSKLVLRHEDSINVLLQESEFILHLNPGKAVSCHFYSKPAALGTKTARTDRCH